MYILSVCISKLFYEMLNQFETSSENINYLPIGCKMLLYPGAFNMITGPAHWELVIRSK